MTRLHPPLLPGRHVFGIGKGTHAGIAPLHAQRFDVTAELLAGQLLMHQEQRLEGTLTLHVIAHAAFDEGGTLVHPKIEIAVQPLQAVVALVVPKLLGQQQSADQHQQGQQPQDAVPRLPGDLRKYAAPRRLGEIARQRKSHDIGWTGVRETLNKV